MGRYLDTPICQISDYPQSFKPNMFVRMMQQAHRCLQPSFAEYHLLEYPLFRKRIEAISNLLKNEKVRLTVSCKISDGLGGFMYSASIFVFVAYFHQIR